LAKLLGDILTHKQSSSTSKAILVLKEALIERFPLAVATNRNALL
jgi:hypothetical protein